MQTSLGRRGVSRCLPSERILRNNIFMMMMMVICLTAAAALSDFLVAVRSAVYKFIYLLTHCL